MEFDEGDPRDPANFSFARKWAITLTASFFSIITGASMPWISIASEPLPTAHCIPSVASSSGAYALGFPSLTRDLNATEFQATIGLSTFTLGFALVPLISTSFSEEFGRQPIYFFSGLGCLLMHMMTAL